MLLLLLLTSLLTYFIVAEFSVAAVFVALLLSFSCCRCCSWHSGIIVANTLQRKSHLCIPFLGIARPQSLVPHSCVCDLHIPRIGPHIFLQQKRQIGRGNILIAYRHMNVEIGTVAA
jgi:hypothetical protein